MSANGDFFELVYDICRHIPRGRVTSYGAVARAAGAAGAARMVGWALNKSGKVLPAVPAHRVVNRMGFLTGKAAFGSPDMMRKLLEDEGVKVENDRVVDFEKLFWDPLVLGEL